MAMHPVIWLGKLGFLKCPSFPFVSARMPVRHTTEVLSVAVGSLDLDYEGDKRRVRRHSDWVSLLRHSQEIGDHSKIILVRVPEVTTPVQ